VTAPAGRHRPAGRHPPPLAMTAVAALTTVAAVTAAHGHRAALPPPDVTWRHQVGTGW